MKTWRLPKTLKKYIFAHALCGDDTVYICVCAGARMRECASVVVRERAPRSADVRAPRPRVRLHQA
eukprot:2327875-Prymnesium_polylepis.1